MEITLEDYVKNWMKENPELIEDALRHGCISGVVSELIYYHDTIKFYLRFQKSISELLNELDLKPSDLIGYDSDDPLCLDTTNQNLLAWFGMEAMLARLYNEVSC
jgi:hypothetical protein